MFDAREDEGSTLTGQLEYERLPSREGTNTGLDVRGKCTRFAWHGVQLALLTYLSRVRRCVMRMMRPRAQRGTSESSAGDVHVSTAVCTRGMHDDV